MKRFLLTLCIAISVLMITSTFTLAGPPIQKVSIVNGPTEPVPVYDVVDRQPFQAEVHVEFDPTQLGGSAWITVPTGKRLVIEFVAGIAGVVTGEVATCFMRTSVGGTWARYYLAITPAGPSGPAKQWTVGQALRIYADSGTMIEIWFGNTLGGIGAFTASISGYLVDM